MYKEIFYQILQILQEITPLNIDTKINEIIEHPAFKKDEIHLKLISEYLGYETYNKWKEKTFTNEIKLDELLNCILLFASISFFLFDNVLNSSEKKELLVRYFDKLDLNFTRGYENNNFFEAEKLLARYKLAYYEQILEIGPNNLDNFNKINEILNILENTEILNEHPEELTKYVIENPKNFYTKKKEYFRDAYFIDCENKKRTSDLETEIENEKTKLLKDIWLPTAKISLKEFLDLGIDKKIWDKNYNLITKKNSYYGSGKSLLSSLSISLKNYAYPDSIDYKVLGKAFCTVFNIEINKNTKEPFKSFISGNPKYIKEFKNLFRIK